MARDMYNHLYFVLDIQTIVQLDPWLCPPAEVVVFAATLAMSSNTSDINSPVNAEHSA